VSVREYRFDCCCASAAQAGGWNPNCDAEPRGKGCAAAASTGGSPPPAPLVQAVVAPDAGVPDADDGAEAGDAPAAVAEAGPDAEPKAGVPDDDDAAVVDATWSPAADGSGPEGGPLTATADATPPSAASPESVDASTAPSGQPTKKGCGCTVAGADDAVWSGLAALGVLLLARKRRRVSTQRSDHSKLRLASPEAPAGSSWGEGIQARSATAVHR
jgi:MYXO-CTERM domain-containing protein